MGHTPFGYKIENGSAVVDEAAAGQIRQIFRSYLEGDSLATAAKKAGVISFHGGISRMLKNKHYLGDKYYPAIIDRETFDRAEQERMRRAAALGRIKEPAEQEGILIPTVFHAKPVEVMISGVWGHVTNKHLAGIPETEILLNTQSYVRLHCLPVVYNFTSILQCRDIGFDFCPV